MKRLLCLCISLVCICGMIVPASADVLWEPYDSNYYQNHSDEFSYLNEVYVVPEGNTVNLYEDPVKGGLVKTLEAGTRVYAGPHGEINGEIWAAGYPLGDWENEGWYRLERMQKEYSHDDFVNDFSDSIIATDDLLTREDVTTEIYSWTYPGSGKPDGTVPAEALGGGYNDGVMTFLYVYTDPDGGRWGYVGYYMGHCGWVYLDDPENPEPPLFPQTPESTVSITAPEKNPGNSMLWIWVFIPALVIVTSCTIVVFKKKAQPASKGEDEHEG